MKGTSTSHDIILRPLTTEKGTRLNAEENKVFFIVRKDANKKQIRRAVEELFEVEVESVNTQIVRGKKVTRWGREVGRKKNWKKAIVTLGEGHRIDFYEGA